MAGSAGARFRPCERLRSGSEYRHAFRAGVRLDGALFALVAVASGSRNSRLGLAVGRRLGHAASRNRAKRLLRESFRRSKAALRVPFDLVLIAKPGLIGRSQDEVEREFRARLRRLAARGGQQPRRPLPAVSD